MSIGAARSREFRFATLLRHGAVWTAAAAVAACSSSAESGGGEDQPGTVSPWRGLPRR